MARQIGPPFIVGRLGGLQFYEMNGKYFVRIAQPSSKGTPQSPRSKENSQEFSELLSVGKDLRLALGWYWRMLKNPQRNGKLVKYLNLVKKADRQSVRGERKVSIGIRSEEGKGYLRGLDLNHVAPLRNSLIRASQLQISITGIHFHGFDPSSDLIFPTGSEGVRITSLLLVADMDVKQYKLIESNSTDVYRNSPVSDLQLTFPEMPSEGSVRFILLSLMYFQTDHAGNTVYAALPENVLSVLDVQ